MLAQINGKMVVCGTASIKVEYQNTSDTLASLYGKQPNGETVMVMCLRIPQLWVAGKYVASAAGVKNLAKIQKFCDAINS